jgi:hypothetical protein
MLIGKLKLFTIIPELTGCYLCADYRTHWAGADREPLILTSPLAVASCTRGLSRVRQIFMPPHSKNTSCFTSIHEVCWRFEHRLLVTELNTFRQEIHSTTDYPVLSS